MSTITLTYTEQDEEQVKKAFDVLMVWFKMDLNQVLQRMNQNLIAVEYANLWGGGIINNVQVYRQWIAGEYYQQFERFKYEDEIFYAIKGHNAVAHILPTVLSEYRKARIPSFGNDYVTWNQPIDQFDSFQIGEKVLYGGIQYESEIENNIYEPGVVASNIWKDLSIPAEPAEDYSNVVMWNPTDHWATYAIGDLRKWNDAIYECKNPTFAQSYEPDSVAGLQYAWTFITNI